MLVRTRRNVFVRWLIIEHTSGTDVSGVRGSVSANCRIFCERSAAVAARSPSTPSAAELGAAALVVASSSCASERLAERFFFDDLDTLNSAAGAAAAAVGAGVALGLRAAGACAWAAGDAAAVVDDTPN